MDGLIGWGSCMSCDAMMRLDYMDTTGVDLFDAEQSFRDCLLADEKRNNRITRCSDAFSSCNDCRFLDYCTVSKAIAFDNVN